jgi:CRP-like cAMP-binding protein
VSIETVLRGHDLFRSLDIGEAHRISSFSAVRRYEANEMIFEQGVPGAHVFMLMKGTVNLQLPTKPKDLSLVISRIKEGELFGLSPLLGSKKYTASAQCMAAAEVLSIEAQPFIDILKSNAAVGQNVMQRVASIYFTRYIELLKSLHGVVNQLALAH